MMGSARCRFRLFSTKRLAAAADLQTDRLTHKSTTTVDPNPTNQPIQSIHPTEFHRPPFRLSCPRPTPTPIPSPTRS